MGCLSCSRSQCDITMKSQGQRVWERREYRENTRQTLLQPKYLWTEPWMSKYRRAVTFDKGLVGSDQWHVCLKGHSTDFTQISVTLPELSKEGGNSSHYVMVMSRGLSRLLATNSQQRVCFKGKTQAFSFDINKNVISTSSSQNKVEAKTYVCVKNTEKQNKT